MVYVVPTKEMGVRKSKEVEPGGRVMEQELEGWERKWEVSMADRNAKALMLLGRHTRLLHYCSR